MPIFLKIISQYNDIFVLDYSSAFCSFNFKAQSDQIYLNIICRYI